MVDFGLGKVCREDGEVINRHLELCAQCRDVVVQAPPDKFLENVRASYLGDSESTAGRRLRPADSPLGAEQRSIRRGNSVTLSRAVVSTPSSAAAREEGDADALQLTSEIPPALLNHPSYRLIRRIGRGGRGSVYLATNLMLDRLEALKVIARANSHRPKDRQRFQQEIRAAARLNHPNIVTAFNAFEADSELVFAMEYVDGKNLQDVVERLGPLSIAKAVYYVYQTALGLQAAHNAKMVHRDIKPNNLMLAQPANKHIIKILDFGFAKAVSEEAWDGGLTESGLMVGTPDFVAPEQTIDARSADIRADIYSLGCTFYYLLSARRPFARDNFIDTIQAQRTADAEPIDEIRRDLPPGLANIISQMMQKQPENRYAQPAEIATALRPFLTSNPSLSHAARATSPPIVDRGMNERKCPSPAAAAPSAKPAQHVGAADSPSKGWRKRFFIRAAALICFAAILIAGRAKFMSGPPAAVTNSQLVVRSDDNSPVMALRQPPGKSMSDQLDRLKNAVTAIATGKGKELDPIKEYNAQMRNEVWLESGTAVEIEEPADAANSSGSSPLEIKGTNLTDRLAGLAESVHVKVRVLNGTCKGMEVWVARERVRREYVAVPNQ